MTRARKESQEKKSNLNYTFLGNKQKQEQPIIFHELEQIKLYLFDINKRLDSIERRLLPETMMWRPPVGGLHATPNPFDRNAIYKGPNKDKGQDFVRKNIAQILKNMVPPSAMDMMPKEVKEAYHNILSVMAPPNDPVWEKEQPKDPREPVEVIKGEFPYNVGELWNSLADTAEKLDKENIDLVGEIAKVASSSSSSSNEEEEEEEKKDDDDESKEETSSK